jgi:predicted MFS family arabinose efflux permease
VGWRLTFATAAGTALLIVAVQSVLLPGIRADGHTRLRDLAAFFCIPFARTGLVATAIVFVGQFAASTYITPLLSQHPRMPHIFASDTVFSTAGYATIGCTSISDVLPLVAG